MDQKHGFHEFEHTADWGIFVWAEDLLALLSTAAEGMFSLLEMKTLPEEDFPLRISLPSSGSKESLVVDFLNELLFLSERNNLAFYEYDLEQINDHLAGIVLGKKIISQGKEIKAVTFHNLEVLETSGGFETSIVFDV